MKKIYLTILAAFCLLVLMYFVFPLPKSESPEKPLYPLWSQRIETSNIERKCFPRMIYYREKNGYTEAGEGLADPRCAQLQRELGNAVAADDIDGVKKLILNGANVESPDNNYDLHYPIVQAVLRKNTDLTALLLDNGADVNRAYICCMTYKPIIYIAVENNDENMVRLLLERKARTDVVTGYDAERSIYDEASNGKSFAVVRLIDNTCGDGVMCRANFRAKIAINFFDRLINFYR